MNSFNDGAVPVRSGARVGWVRQVHTICRLSRAKESNCEQLGIQNPPEFAGSVFGFANSGLSPLFIMLIPPVQKPREITPLLFLCLPPLTE